jgi:hypothetical protein
MEYLCNFFRFNKLIYIPVIPDPFTRGPYHGTEVQFNLIRNGHTKQGFHPAAGSVARFSAISGFFIG